MQYSRTNQAGSVLTFVIVGVLLTGLVVGGVYLLRQRGEQARTGQPAVTKTDDSKQKPQSQAPAQSANEDKDKKPESKPAPQQTTPSQNSGNTGYVPSTGQSPAPATQTPQSGTKPNVASGAPIDHSANLPATGPLDTLLQLVAMGTLTALTIAYIRSRLQAAPSL